MKNRLSILLLLFLTLALLPFGCGQSVDNPAMTSSPADMLPPPKTNWGTSGPPPAGLPGLPRPHILTDAEKTEVLRIALEFPATANWLKGRTDFRVTSFDWYAIMWTENGQQGIDWALGDAQFAASGVPSVINPNAYWYPGLTIAASDSYVSQMQIAVALDTGKVALADGPYIPPGPPK